MDPQCSLFKTNLDILFPCFKFLNRSPLPVGTSADSFGISSPSVSDSLSYCILTTFSTSLISGPLHVLPTLPRLPHPSLYACLCLHFNLPWLPSSPHPQSDHNTLISFLSWAFNTLQCSCSLPYLSPQQSISLASITSYLSLESQHTVLCRSSKGACLTKIRKEARKEERNERQEIERGEKAYPLREL